MEKQSQHLIEQKELLSRYTHLLEERKKDLEKEFSDFIKQPAKTKTKEEIAQLNQLLSEGKTAEPQVHEPKSGFFSKLSGIFRKK